MSVAGMTEPEDLKLSKSVPALDFHVRSIAAVNILSSLQSNQQGAGLRSSITKRKKENSQTLLIKTLIEIST